MTDYLCKGEDDDARVSRKDMDDQIIRTFVKLKHNPAFEMLAKLCRITKTTAIDYFWKWLNIMNTKLKFLIKMQVCDNIFKTIPPVFKSKLPCLTSITDCFGVFIESSGALLTRAQCYSNYKKQCTTKVFISCIPYGAILFCQSVGVVGYLISLQFKSLGFCSSELHIPGDQVLANWVFTLKDDFVAGSGSELIIPAFTKNKSQLSANEVEASQNISLVQIYIECVIGLFKNRYTILNGIMPIMTVKSIKDESLQTVLAT